ncbi:type I-E CRISPR-associated protein Cas7/Cse4/CasC [Fontivita pretiosa]|uniref:type I-E CRISPR-associated protein Cas7/Cse4/CasC n=1 Tax=Fontivita pretiosa TaxID=2989684 RepID=UPI003D16BE03
MLIEIHVIQNHSPSNLNSDDLGAPKTCIFGGVTRARISSQCLKRSIRNPGNPEDVHNRGPGIFAQAMAAHIGIRTKLFPWLVGQKLKKTSIPEDEHARIIMAAQRIATAKEKEQKKSKDDTADNRPKTPQLISFGPEDARRFVETLVELRKPENGKGDTNERYAYFLNPRVGFEEMVRAYLDDSGLDDKIIDKIVKASWVIAKCRMSQLPKDDESESSSTETPQDVPSESPGGAGEKQPGPVEAERIAAVLRELSSTDEKEFKKLTKKATAEEQKQVKEDAPKKPDKYKDFMEALRETLRCNAIDIALFGRMTTSDAFEDVEAAMQVAHAISTHAVINEVDYFTAVDDLGKAGGGAGHVDEAMFNSACFYKYFCLDWDQLVKNLAGPQPDKDKDAAAHKRWKDEIEPQASRLAACALGHFIRAAAMTTPSGKQNSFASHTEPCGILVEIKRNGKHPTNYANAFAEPVERIGKPDDDAADEKSIEGRSVACLADHVRAIRQAYGIDSTLLWYSPKLWRFPLQYWERDENGKRQHKEILTDKRYSALGGNDDGKAGLVEAVIEELQLGFKWSEVMNIGKTELATASPTPSAVGA